MPRSHRAQPRPRIETGTWRWLARRWLPAYGDDVREPIAIRPGARLRGSWQWHAVASIIGGLILWEVIARFVLRNPAFLVPPSTVLLRGWEMLLSGQLLYQCFVSGQEFLWGFLLASVVGILLGALMAISGTVRAYLDPWISAAYAAPIIALAPLIILWFGVDVLSKVVVVFVLVVFPMIINTEAGIRSTDENLIRMARSFGAGRVQMFFTVALPSALPFVVSGLRLGVGRGLTAVVVGELFGARAGLGYLIYNSSQVFDMATLFVAVAILAIAGIVLTRLLQRLERHLSVYRQPARTQL